MDWANVAERIQRGEDEFTEFKRSFDPKRSGPALAAFANSAGGVLIFGVDDDRRICGVKQPLDKLAEQITSFLQSGLNAPLRSQLGWFESPDGLVVWLDVPRQRGFEPLRYAGAVYVRRGRASVEPAPSELAELYNTFGYIVTEERTIDAATVDQIDVQVFATYLRRQGLDFYAEPRVDFVEDLLARGVVAHIGGDVRATVYGVLAFGKTPQMFSQTSQFFIQCVQYAGDSQAAPVLQVADATGRIDEQVDRALGWLMGLGRREIYRGADREDIPLIPLAAAREVLVNAVAHRDYAILGSKILVERFSDRLVVTNPGKLPNGLTPQSVIRGGSPRARNQSLTHFLLTMGKMEQRGRGWPIVRQAMATHNGTEPMLEEDRESRWIRVTLWTPTWEAETTAV